jgi:hypothetical protein
VRQRELLLKGSFRASQKRYIRIVKCRQATQQSTEVNWRREEENMEAESLCAA